MIPAKGKFNTLQNCVFVTDKEKNPKKKKKNAIS